MKQEPIIRTSSLTDSELLKREHRIAEFCSNARIERQSSTNMFFSIASRLKHLITFGV